MSRTRTTVSVYVECFVLSNTLPQFGCRLVFKLSEATIQSHSTFLYKYTSHLRLPFSQPHFCGGATTYQERPLGHTYASTGVVPTQPSLKPCPHGCRTTIMPLQHNKLLSGCYTQACSQIAIRLLHIGMFTSILLKSENFFLSSLTLFTLFLYPLSITLGLSRFKCCKILVPHHSYLGLTTQAHIRRGQSMWISFHNFCYKGTIFVHKYVVQCVYGCVWLTFHLS